MSNNLNGRKLAKIAQLASAKATQPSALRHHRGPMQAQVQRFSGEIVRTERQGFERRVDFVSDSKRGQVYVIQRLSDPSNHAVVAERIEKLTDKKAEALKFLQSIGVASGAGRLTERFGG